MYHGYWFEFQAAGTFTFLGGRASDRDINNITSTIGRVIPSTPPGDVTHIIAEDIDLIEIDIGIDDYVGLVRHVFNGHEFEQDVQSWSL
jgi:hypothetical protein